MPITIIQNIIEKYLKLNQEKAAGKSRSRSGDFPEEEYSNLKSIAKQSWKHIKVPLYDLTCFILKCMHIQIIYACNNSIFKKRQWIWRHAEKSIWKMGEIEGKVSELKYNLEKEIMRLSWII